MVKLYYEVNALDCSDAWFKVNSLIYNRGIPFVVEAGSEVTLTKKIALTLNIIHPYIRPLVNDKSPSDVKQIGLYALKYLWLGEKTDEEDYTYGYRLRHPVDQVEAMINSYVKCLNNRQNTMVIRVPDDVGIENPPCLSLIDTEVIFNKLNLTCYFRSWDAYAGLPTNIAGLQIFNEALVNEINERGNLALEAGSMTFHCKNAHIYSRCFPLVKQLLEGK